MARSSKYEEVLSAAGAEYGEWLGVPVVESFGDPQTEYSAAAEHVAVADRSSRGTVVATGSEVVPLLQGVVTNDLFKLADEGSGQRSCMANTTGRFVCDLRFLHVPDILLMDFEPGLLEDGVLSSFRANVITEDAKFVDRSAHTSRVVVVGPAAAETLEARGDWEHDLADIDDYDGSWGSIDGHDVIMQRVPTFGVAAYELLFGTEAAVDIWTALTDGGATPAGNAALETLRIENGIPRWGAELDEKVIPLEAGFADDIAFDKGCYVGQEIIARLDTLGTPAKILRMLVIESDEDVPEVGADVFHDDKNVGSIRSSVRSPRLGAPIALAYLKRDHNEPGTHVQVGERSEAVVHPVDEQSRPPRVDE